MARSRFSRSGMRARALRRAAWISAKSIISAIGNSHFVRDDYRSSRACVKLSAQLPARATLLRQSPMPALGHPSHLPRHPVENLDLARRQSAASENLADREHDMLRVVVGN